MKLLLSLVATLATLNASFGARDPGQGLSWLYELISASAADRSGLIGKLDRTWTDTNLAAIGELMPFVDTQTRSLLLELAARKMGEEAFSDYQDFRKAIWKRPPNLAPMHAEFKATLYRQLDGRFDSYFSNGQKTTIRLDEVVWGGVRQNGIPPLVDPKLVAAADANHVEEDEVVFAVVIGQDARAYPKRILGWHEMVVETIAGVRFTGVYCTLCGSFIGYDSRTGDITRNLGTSGFLYRSNKLMFDQQTKSLWNKLTGKPVVGDLVNQGIQLRRIPVVTTTWGEWKRRHPDTRVLSLNTGYDRDYSVGAAYGTYWATDELMFAVPIEDRRLRNKAEILALISPDPDVTPLAISHQLLLGKTPYNVALGELQLVVLTDDSGAHRVYEKKEVSFERWDQAGELIDSDGKKWLVSETAIVNENGDSLRRFPSHNSFWFGWINTYPNTKLIE